MDLSLFSSIIDSKADVAREAADSAAHDLADRIRELKTQIQVDAVCSKMDGHGRLVPTQQIPTTIVNSTIADLNQIESASNKLITQVELQTTLLEQTRQLQVELLKEYDSLRIERRQWIEQREVEQRHLISRLVSKLQVHDPREPVLAEVLQHSLSLGVPLTGKEGPSISATAGGPSAAIETTSEGTNKDWTPTGSENSTTAPSKQSEAL